MTRFMRFVAEFEVEIVDATQARAYAMDWAQGDDGTPMLEEHTDESAATSALRAAWMPGLSEAAEKAGLHVKGGSLFPRMAEGIVYPTMPIPSLPVRRDDGSVDEDWINQTGD